MKTVSFRAHARPDLMALSWRLRHDVFNTERGWDLPVRNLLDIDRYDTLANHVCLIDNDLVCGYLRALPTTGPYLLKDSFPQLAGGAPPQDARLWEISRFAISPTLPRADSKTAAQRLVQAGVAASVGLGADRLIAVTEPPFARFLQNCGLVIEAMSDIQIVGDSTRGPVRALGITCALDHRNLAAMNIPYPSQTRAA